MKSIIVTGLFVGIEKEAALNLAKLGYRILRLFRESDKEKQAREEIVAQTEKEN